MLAFMMSWWHTTFEHFATFVFSIADYFERWLKTIAKYWVNFLTWDLAREAKQANWLMEWLPVAFTNMTRKVLGSHSEVSRDSTKPTKMIAEQENNVWRDCEKLYFSIKLLKDTFE